MAEAVEMVDQLLQPGDLVGPDDVDGRHPQLAEQGDRALLALTGLVSGRQAETVGTTVVHFADVTDEEIAAYVATEEPLNVAGSFTIDGRGAAFVERIEGDPGNVIGLSLPLLRRLLIEMDVSITALWRA